MSQPASPPSAPVSPFCAALRSKNFYFLESAPRSAQELLDGSNRCWCLRTMQAMGPDGEQVDPQGCQAGRTCFEPLGRPRA